MDPGLPSHKRNKRAQSFKGKRTLIDTRKLPYVNATERNNEPIRAQPSQNWPAAGSISLLFLRFDRLHSGRKMLFLFCLSARKKKPEKTLKSKGPDNSVNNLKVSVPTVFTSLEVFKAQTSFRSFFNYKSGNIHCFYLSIG